MSKLRVGISQGAMPQFSRDHIMLQDGDSLHGMKLTLVILQINFSTTASDHELTNNHHGCLHGSSYRCEVCITYHYWKLILIVQRCFVSLEGGSATVNILQCRSIQTWLTNLYIISYHYWLVASSL